MPRPCWCAQLVVLLVASVAVAGTLPLTDEVDQGYPLGPQLRVLAADVKSPNYRKLVTEKMLITDLAAEWQRVATDDNAERFLKDHGGKEKVLADPLLRRAYERRVEIRDQFLELMRAGYRRYRQTPPFDRGAQAEAADTTRHEAAGKYVVLHFVLPAAGAAEQWPRFRGPSGQGATGGQELPVHWDRTGKNILWRVPTPGHGNSSPIIWDNRLFLTSSAADGSARAVHCFRVADGKLLWTRQPPSAPPESGVRSKNGYASATPVTDGQHVIAFLGSVGLVCYRVDGTLLWHHPVRCRTMHGTGSSPLLYKDKVILIQDQNQADPIFVALDKHTGKVCWQQPRQRAMTWSTPVVIQVGDHDELIFAGGETIRGYDPDTGRELWTASGPTPEVIPTFVVGNDLLYCASGRNGPTLALRPGGQGDVTKTHLVWRSVRSGPHVPSPIYVQGRLYIVNDTGVATCLDAHTGKLIWQERLPDHFAASPIEAGGLLYFPAESGVTYVLRAADQFTVVAQNDLVAPILASPAVAGKLIFLRTTEELLCIGPP